VFACGLIVGYLAHFRNPLSGILRANDLAFTVQPGMRLQSAGGDFSIDNYFRGRPGILWLVVEYQDAMDPLRFRSSWMARLPE